MEITLHRESVLRGTSKATKRLSFAPAMGFISRGCQIKIFCRTRWLRPSLSSHFQATQTRLLCSWLTHWGLYPRLQQSRPHSSHRERTSPAYDVLAALVRWTLTIRLSDQFS